MKKYLLALFCATSLSATPIILNIGGQRVTISPPSDLPVLYSIPTNTIFTVTIPGITNYQTSYITFTNWIASISTNYGGTGGGGSATNISGGTFSNVTLTGTSILNAKSAYNLLNYGFIPNNLGDAVVNDFAWINLCKILTNNAGNDIYVPGYESGGGEFYFSQPLNIPLNQWGGSPRTTIHIYGDGSPAAPLSLITVTPPNGSLGCIISTNSGGIEIDHLAIEGENGGVPNIFIGATTPFIHDNLFNDSGGTNIVLGNANFSFSGYGGTIVNNRQGNLTSDTCFLWAGENVNTMLIENNYMLGGHGWTEMYFQGPYDNDNKIWGNTFELGNWTNAIVITNQSDFNNIIGNDFDDPGAGTQEGGIIGGDCAYNHTKNNRLGGANSTFPTFLTITPGANTIFESETNVVGPSGLHGNFYGNVPNVFNVMNYGAKGDVLLLTNATIAAGSLILTDSVASFTSLDVGKFIRIIQGNNYTNDLCTGISNIINGTCIGLSNSAVLGITNTQIYYGHNDSVAIESADSAALAAGGGIVYFPTALYGIATNFDSKHALISFPDIPSTGITGPTVEWEGTVLPCQTPLYIGSPNVQSTYGSVLVDLVHGGGNGYSLVCCSNLTTSANGFNLMVFATKNIRMTLETCPQMNGLNAGNASSAQIFNTMVDDGWFAYDTPNNYGLFTGIIFPLINNSGGGTTTADGDTVTGFPISYKVSESLHAGTILAQEASLYGVDLLSSYHASMIDKLCIVGCATNIYVPSTLSSNQRTLFTIGQVDSEVDTNGVWDSTIDYYSDPNTNGYGSIEQYYIVQAGYGFNPSIFVRDANSDVIIPPNYGSELSLLNNNNDYAQFSIGDGSVNVYPYINTVVGNSIADVSSSAYFTSLHGNPLNLVLNTTTNLNNTTNYQTYIVNSINGLTIETLQGQGNVSSIPRPINFSVWNGGSNPNVLVINTNLGINVLGTVSSLALSTTISNQLATTQLSVIVTNPFSVTNLTGRDVGYYWTGGVISSLSNNGMPFISSGMCILQTNEWLSFMFSSTNLFKIYAKPL